jgi:hypothetical protein
LLFFTAAIQFTTTVNGASVPPSPRSAGRSAGRLLIAAKKQAAEDRTTLGKIFESGLWRELQVRGEGVLRKRVKPIRWVTSKGGLPPGLDISSREKMWDWIMEQKKKERR